MAKIEGLTIEIGADTTSFGKAMKEIETEARGISKDLKTVDDTLRTNSQNAEAAAAKLDLLRDAYKNASQKVETIKAAIKQLNKEFYGNESSAEYRSQLKKLEDQLRSATLEQDRALEKVVAFKNAEDEAAEGTSRLGDIIKGNLISTAITKGLGILVDLLKSAAKMAIEAVKGVANFVGETIELAKNMEETKSKVAAVFGEEGQAQINEWAENAAHDFHTTKQAAMEAVSAFGNILLNMGMASEEAMKYSEQLVLVAAAQADFNNMETTEVLEKITSALSGNYKGLQSLGIVLKEADIAERALIDTGKENADQLTDLEKKQAALALIIEKSDFAVQKYSENTGSLVSMQAELKAKLTDVKTEIGERLYPVAEKIFNKIIDFTNTEQFTQLLDTIYDAFDQIATSVLNFISSGQLDQYIQWLTDNLPYLGDKITEVAGKVADVVDSIWNAIEAFRQWKEEVRNNITDALENSGLFDNLPGAESHAAGGPVKAGRMYQVNDDAGHRMEYFMPYQNGYILNGSQTDRIINNNNSRTMGNVNVYVTSYGTDAASIADEIGAELGRKLRMAGSW